MNLNMMNFYQDDTGVWYGHTTKGNRFFFDAVGSITDHNVMFNLFNMVSHSETYKGEKMTTEFNFDNEFDPIKDLSPEEAWTLFGINNPEDWDTID